jgi:hypothetical protein
MRITQSEVNRGEYWLSLSQVIRDSGEITRGWGIPTGELLTENFHVLKSAMSTKQHRLAFTAAWLIKAQNWKTLGRNLQTHVSATYLRAIADALDAIQGKDGRKPHFQLPTPTCANIAASYLAAVSSLHHVVFGQDEGLLRIGENDPTKPTLFDVKKEFVRLFCKTKLPADCTRRQLERLKGEKKLSELPADWSIRKTLTRLGLQLRPDTRGRPMKSAAK